MISLEMLKREKLSEKIKNRKKKKNLKRKKYNIYKKK